MNIAQSERMALTDLLTELGPDAPTLCEGWNTGDLAAHLFIRENDPIAAGGIMIGPLASHTEKKMDEVLAKKPWAELVEAVRTGPSGFSLFRVPGVDEAANAFEFFIHTEDIRRAQTPDPGTRDLPRDVEDFMWKRLRLLGKTMFRNAKTGLVLERSDDERAEPLRVKPGSATITLIGKPSELVLYSSGRKDHADVRVVGDPAAVAEFNKTKTGL